MTLTELTESGQGRYLSWSAAASVSDDIAFYIPAGAKNVSVQVASSGTYTLTQTADARTTVESDSAAWFFVLPGTLTGSRQASLLGPATAVRVVMVSGTAQITIRAQSDIPREHSVWLNFGDVWENVTGYLYGRTPVSCTRAIHNNLAPVVAQAQFTMDRGASIANRILSASGEIQVRILKDGVSWFVGTVRKTIKVQIGQTRMESIRFQCVDAWLRLDKKKPQTSVLWRNFALSNPTTRTQSLLHQLFYAAGFSPSELDLEPVPLTFDAFSVWPDESTTYRTLIEGLLSEAGYSAYVDRFGIVRLYDLGPTAIDAMATLTTGRDGALVAPFEIERLESRYNGVAVEWYSHRTILGDVIFEDRKGGNATLACMIPLLAGEYYPEGADAETSIRAKFMTSGGEEFLCALDPVLEWEHTGDVELLDSTIDGNSMMLKFFSPTGGAITKLQIIGDSIVNGSMTRIVREEVPGTSELEVVRTNLIYTQAAASRLAIIRAEWNAYSDFRYTFATTLTSLEPGQFVRILDTAVLGIDVVVRIVQVTEGADPKQIQCVAEGVTEYHYEALSGAVELPAQPGVGPAWEARLAYSGGQAQAAASAYALGLASAIRLQLDRQVITHEDVAPYTDPSLSWLTDDDKRSHHWDHWHKAGDGGIIGTWWKWIWVETVSAGSWIQVTDGPELYALNAAHDAQVTADGKSTTWGSQSAAESGGAVVGDSYASSGILYRCTGMDPYAWSRLTPKRHPDGAANPTTDLVDNDTFYDTDDYQWRIYQGGSWVDDGPPMTPEGIGAVTTATAPRYLGRYEAAHPTSKNSGDWWVVYDDDTGDAGRPGNGHPERGVWWLDGTTSRRIDGASTMAEQAKLVAALGDVSWAERNGYGESADYEIDVLLEAIAATTAFLQTLYAQEIILSTDGYIKSSNYAETGGLPTAGFKLDHATNTVSAYAAKFVNATISGKASLREIVIADVTPGSYVAKEKSFGSPGLTTSSTSYVYKASMQFVASGEVAVFAQTSGSSSAATGYIKVDRMDSDGSFIETVMESEHTNDPTGYGTQNHGVTADISEGDYLYVYVKSGSGLYQIGVQYIAIKIAEKPGILPYLGS